MMFGALLRILGQVENILLHQEDCPMLLCLNASAWQFTLNDTIEHNTIYVFIY